MGRLERLLNKAINFTESGKCEEALNILNKAYKLAPDDPEVYNSYALTYDAMDNFELSIASYKQALKLNSKDPNIYTQYGIT
ncbi:MAG: tetratricopeptide repeat protein, partial [Thermodesulfobacteriota bacterium]